MSESVDTMREMHHRRQMPPALSVIHARSSVAMIGVGEDDGLPAMALELRPFPHQEDEPMRTESAARRMDDEREQERDILRRLGLVLRALVGREESDELVVYDQELVRASETELDVEYNPKEGSWTLRVRSR